MFLLFTCRTVFAYRCSCYVKESTATSTYCIDSDFRADRKSRRRAGSQNELLTDFPCLCWVLVVFHAIIYKLVCCSNGEIICGADVIISVCTGCSVTVEKRIKACLFAFSFLDRVPEVCCSSLCRHISQQR